jgi:hypothetical protein
MKVRRPMIIGVHAQKHTAKALNGRHAGSPESATIALTPTEGKVTQHYG